MPLGWRGQRLVVVEDEVVGLVERDGEPPGQPERVPATGPRSTSGSTASGSTVSGCSPERPSRTALSVACPRPVRASEPYRSARTRRTCARTPARSSARTKRRAAHIGPTVCELDGPMPILNRSKTLRAMRSGLTRPVPRTPPHASRILGTLRWRKARRPWSGNSTRPAGGVAPVLGAVNRPSPGRPRRACGPRR